MKVSGSKLNEFNLKKIFEIMRPFNHEMALLNSKWVNEEENWDDHKFTGPKNQMKTSPLDDDFINQWTRVFESVYEDATSRSSKTRLLELITSRVKSSSSSWRLRINNHPRKFFSGAF